MDDNNRQQDEEDRGRKSSVDRVNDIVNKSQTAARRVRNLQQALKYARRARLVVAVVQTAIGTAPAWIIPAVVIFFIIIIAAAILLLFPQPGGEPPPQVTCDSMGGTCENTCTPPLIQDNTGAVCIGSDQGKVCCIGPKTCESIGGVCQESSTCTDGKIPNSTAICSDTTKPFCCSPPPDDCVALGKSLDAVACWAKLIASKLQPYSQSCNGSYFYNVQLATITNGSYFAEKHSGSRCGLNNHPGADTYFCTNTVKDAYNLAGFANNWPINTRQMIGVWLRTPGHRVLLNTWDAISQLRPGDVVFYQHCAIGVACGNNSGHIQVVVSVNLNPDSRSGTIGIVQSNSYSTSNTLRVSNGGIVITTFPVILIGLGPR